MRTVRDDEGNVYLLLKRSRESSRVRDPATGEERYLPNDRLEPVDGESPLETAARAVPAPVRRVLRVASTDRALGLLVELDRRPRSVRELLDAYDLCESDLHGLLAECAVAGVVEETTVAGERGYRVTDEASDALARLQG
ncbi:hypothetical protein ACFQH6_06560 [Halobacteriaceae archaeon GCM10025711]